jgi:hypothetical protein
VVEDEVSLKSVRVEDDRVTTAWEETARRPNAGRLTGDEVLEVGMAGRQHSPLHAAREKRLRKPLDDRLHGGRN